MSRLLRSVTERNPATACSYVSGQPRQPQPRRLVVSNVVSFAWVRGRPPGPTSYGQARSRTGVNPGERWSALLESALGATPREFESRILRSLDLRRRAQIMFARCPTARSVCLIFCLSLSPGHMPYSGQIGVMAR